MIGGAEGVADPPAMARRRGLGGQLLGDADCEAWGRFGQPTNAVTSAAYVAAGAWLATRARHVAPDRRWRVHVAALGGVATGLGSIAYHGVGGRLSHVLHDGSMLVLLAWTPVGVTAPVPPWAADTARRRRRLALAATALGLVAYRLGRTGARTCDPTSRWQWHGVWHVAGAVATAAWADATDVLPHLPDRPPR